MPKSIFSNVGGLKPGRTAFNLSHEHIYTCGFGELVPVAVLETLPGDSWNLNLQVLARLSGALVSPAMARFDAVFEAFYVPLRILMGSDANFEYPAGESRFEEVLHRGDQGLSDLSVPFLGGVNDGHSLFYFGGLSDFFGIQMDMQESNGSYRTVVFFDDVRISALPWRAYRYIWNEYYRVEFLQDPVQVCQYLGNGNSSSDDTFLPAYLYDSLLRRSWRRDYFTSALPFQQFGTSPAFNLDGLLPVEFSGTSSRSIPDSGSLDPRVAIGVNPSDSTDFGLGTNNSSGILQWTYGIAASVNLNNAVTFDISDIRTNFQIQKWLERNARGGVRYTEYLQSHFGCSPSDARLQRPQFIGAFRMPFYNSEVLQTSSNVDGSPQGNQAGQSISVGHGNLGKYRSYEYGYIFILGSVVPKPIYQQGIPRMFTRTVWSDFYVPEFAHLSEQAINQYQIFYDHEASPNEPFGFTGIWNELRFLPSHVSKHMRSNAPGYSFDYWHQARFFSETPELNSDFLTIGGTPESQAELMRIFAVQDEDPFIFDVGIDIKPTRPMPFSAEPGLVDHF